MKYLRDVMTGDVEMVFPHSTLREAAAKMKKLDIGMLPVCDGDRLTGIITDRDIVIRAVSQNCNPEQTLVGDVMTHDVVYLFEDEPVQDAAALMQKKQIRRLIVLDRSKKLCGIVSLGDLAAETSKRLAGRTLKAVSQAPTTEEGEKEKGFSFGLTRGPVTAFGVLLGTVAAVATFRLLKRSPEQPSEHLSTPEELPIDRTSQFLEQESREGGIISPIKNEIVEEHARLHSAGDPAVRRINPSREEAGVKTIKRPFLGKGRS